MRLYFIFDAYGQYLGGIYIKPEDEARALEKAQESGYPDAVSVSRTEETK